MENRLDRRSVVQGMTAVASAGFLGPVGVAFAQAGEIATTSFPGAWEQAIRSIIIPVFKERTGASVNLTAQNPNDSVSKAIASKANPPYDALLLDEGPYIAAKEHGIFETIPTDLMPNMKDLPAKFIDPNGLGVFVSGQIIGIAYNPERIKVPPKSWQDLLKPEFKGRVGLAGMGATLNVAWMVEMAKLGGGSEENLEPAYEFLRKLMPNVGALTISPGSLATLFQQGQVDISVHYNNNVGDMQAKGVPIALARPDTGFLLIRSTMHIAKNSRNQKLAAAYINTVIDPSVQTKMSSAPYHLVPTNSKVPFSEGLQRYAKNMSEIEQFKTVDWSKFNPRFADYTDQCNRIVKR
jgi:putative spermidine/putrescine transport system substrate-binding protein